MKDFMPGELDVPWVHMVGLRQAGRLVLGIDETSALRITNSGIMNGTATANSFHNKGIFSMAVLLASVVASFVYAWWWFIPGSILAMVLHSANKRGNSQNLLDLAVKDLKVYNAVRAQKLWQYRMSEEDAASYRRAEAAG